MRRSPLLDRPGASPNAKGDPDELVPAHYGDPLREQGLLESGAGVTALARDVVAVTGPDRLSWLTTLSSQALTGLTPDDGGVETLLLDARGRISHALAALDDAETLWLVTEAGRGPALVEFLERMRFMLRVEVVVREDVAVLAAMGDGPARLEAAAREALGAADAGAPDSRGNAGAPGPRVDAGTADLGASTPGPPDPRVPSAPLDGPASLDATPGAPAAVRPGVWRDPWPGVVEGGTSYDVGLTRPHPGSTYRAGFVLVPVEAVGAVVDAFLTAAPGRGPVGSLAWEALRIEAGRPRWARDVDERAIPHELDWLRTAVHLTKGCYPGQETVARTLNLGRPPRRLTILQLDGLAGRLPAPGAVVRLGERAVGTVTSVTRHHDYGPMALALLRRGVPADAALTADITDAVGIADAAEGSESSDAAEDPEGPAGDDAWSRRGAAAIARVDAVQEPLVSPEGKAQASPAQRPGAGLRRSLLH